MSADRKPPNPLGVVCLLLLASGFVAWAWTGEWRWAITSTAVVVVLGAVGAALDGRRSR